MSYGDYVELLTYLLFLKMADERTKPSFNQPSAVPAKYNRPTLMNLMLHSIGSDKDIPIAVSDSLAADPGDRFDIVLT